MVALEAHIYTCCDPTSCDNQNFRVQRREGSDTGHTFFVAVSRLAGNCRVGPQSTILVFATRTSSFQCQEIVPLVVLLLSRSMFRVSLYI